MAEKVHHESPKHKKKFESYVNARPFTANVKKHKKIARSTMKNTVDAIDDSYLRDDTGVRTAARNEVDQHAIREKKVM